MAVKKRKKSRFEFLTRKFPLRMQRKLVMLFMAVVLAFVVLIGRITYINVTKGSKYTKVVLDQQNYDSRVIAFKRGDIVDRNGTKMATSERVYNVILDVAVMMDKKEYIEPTKEVLKECFNVEGDVVDKLIKESPDSRYEVLVSDVDYATHVCRGNYHSTYASSGPYDSVADVLFGEENVSAYYLEFDDERSGGFAPLAKIGSGQKVVLGLITTKQPQLENKEAVIARIHEAAKYIPLDRLYLSPQCGFASCEIGNKLTEEEQWAKLALVKEIAEEVWG